VPEDADTPRFRTSIGSVHYAPEKSAIIWKIKQFGGGKEFLMRAELGLPSVKGDDEHGGGMTGGFGGSMGGAQAGKGKRPISVKFEIPYFTTSGIQVRYLKIIEPKVSDLPRTALVLRFPSLVPSTSRLCNRAGMFFPAIGAMHMRTLVSSRVNMLLHTTITSASNSTNTSTTPLSSPHTCSKVGACSTYVQYMHLSLREEPKNLILHRDEFSILRCDTSHPAHTHTQYCLIKSLEKKCIG
jgi:hypothetical protein